MTSRPGEGASFHIYLPAAAADEESETPETPAMLAALGSG
jgi:hypothetical protein